jgi:hypothetical protein
MAQAGSSVIIVGRNQTNADRILQELRQLSPPHASATFDFVRADLTLRSEIKRAADELEAKAGSKGIAYFFQTQVGRPALQLSSVSSAGHDTQRKMGGDLRGHRITLCPPMPLQIRPALLLDPEEGHQGSRRVHLVSTPASVLVQLAHSVAAPQEVARRRSTRPTAASQRPKQQASTAS